ncbi:hypothetical protein MRY87_05165 [bacterium]|nr:hypothetical protein [bacterium]
MTQLYLSSFGFAQPETRLRSLSLGEFSSLLEEQGGATRDLRTALAPSYLEETFNEDPFQRGEEIFQETPTSLGERSARAALEGAKVSTEDLGLILGASSTPLQTTPVEAQRIGKQLGVKIPAYEINAGGTDLLLHIENLLSWKRDRIPAYTLSVSSNIPTSRIHYKKGSERFRFSDAAGAFLLSPEKGRYRIEHVQSEFSPAEAQQFSVELYGHLRYEENVVGAFLQDRFSAVLGTVRSQISERAVIIESNLEPSRHERLQESFSGSYQWRRFLSQTGDLLGATPAAALSLFESDEEAEQIVILTGGIGLVAGVLILTREGE